MTNQDFWKWVDEEREARRLSFAEMERIADVGNATIGRPARNLGAPTDFVCRAIARAFRVEPEAVFRRAGLLPAIPEDTAETAEAAHRDASPVMNWCL